MNSNAGQVFFEEASYKRCYEDESEGYPRAKHTREHGKTLLKDGSYKEEVESNYDREKQQGRPYWAGETELPEVEKRCECKAHRRAYRVDYKRGLH